MAAMVEERGVSVRQACQAVRLSRSRYYAPVARRDDSRVMEALEAYVKGNPRHGFDKLYPVLRQRGFSKSRLYRVYRQLGLNLKRRGQRRLPARIRVPLQVPAVMNAVWSADCMADALWNGRRFRTFNVLDDCNREALRIEIEPACRPGGWCGRWMNLSSCGVAPGPCASIMARN